MSPSSSRTGVLQALGAYILWGLFPLYFRALHGLPPLEIVGHRVVWCLVFLAIVLGLRQQWRWLPQALRDQKVMAVFATSALLVAANWSAYIWTVDQGRVIEAALGYFINPLMSVLFGAVFLRERLTPLQWLAIGLATAGVTAMGVQLGHVPWMAMLIAATFSGYGLVRKVAPRGPLEGLALETVILALPAVLWLAWLHRGGQAHLGQATPAVQTLVVLSGAITAVPLLLFAASTRRIPMSWVGMLQYVGPTLQTIIGVVVFHEAILPRLPALLLIWSGCALFCIDLLRLHRPPPVARPAAHPATTIGAPPGA